MKLSPRHCINPLQPCRLTFPPCFQPCPTLWPLCYCQSSRWPGNPTDGSSTITRKSRHPIHIYIYIYIYIHTHTILLSRKYNETAQTNDVGVAHGWWYVQSDESTRASQQQMSSKTKTNHQSSAHFCCLC
jgi:hypothetical protein